MAELAVTVRSTDPTELNDVTCQWNSRSVIITVERKHEWLYYAVLKFTLNFIRRAGNIL